MEVDSSGRPTFSRVEPKGKLSSFAAFSVAYWRLARLELIFRPSRTADAFKFYENVYSWHKNGVSITSIIEYFEAFRFNHQRSDRLWCDVDNVLLSQVTIASGIRRTSHSNSASSSTGSSSSISSMSATQRALTTKIFKASRSKLVCSKWQSGLCGESGAHVIGKNKITVRHVCVHCDGDHPFSSCPDKESF